MKIKLFYAIGEETGKLTGFRLPMEPNYRSAMQLLTRQIAEFLGEDKEVITLSHECQNVDAT